MALHLILALGADSTLAALGLAALLTYLLHSVIWCGAAALLVRTRACTPSTQSYLWLAALFGPLLTVSIATAASSSLPHVEDVQVVSLAASRPSPAAHGGGERPLTSGVFGVLLALGVAVALGGLQFASSLISLRRRLRHRVRLEDSRILQRLDRLRHLAALRHVTLTQSAAIDVPLVLGRAEICLPAESLSAASVSEIDAVLAHELAHIARRDGVIFPLVGFVQAIGWLHPLHRWVASRFRHAAELACDDFAVELTGDRMALAQALVRVAQNAMGAPRASMVPAMARPRAASALSVRVRRLVAPVRTSPRGSSSWIGASCTALAVLTAGVSVRAARAPQVPQPAAFEERSAAAPATATDPIGDLMERAELLEREIARLQRSAAGRRESDPELLELQQQLRHARETAAWIERESSGRERP